MGVKELQNEIEEIRLGTNPGLSVLGVLLTMADRTVITRETFDALVAQFGDLVFETQIRLMCEPARIAGDRQQHLSVCTEVRRGRGLFSVGW